MSIRTILLDDNIKDLESLQRELSDVSFIKIEASFSNPVEAMSYIVEHKPDLLISDIQMPSMNGIQAIKTLEKPPLIIFISSYPEYALESFDVKPLHYLVKPFTKESLLKALYRAYDSVQLKQIAKDDFMFVYADKKYERISYADILYIKAEQNYVRIVTKKQYFLVLTNLTQFLKQLPTGQFIRVHKSFAVNTQNITSYNAYDVYFDKEVVPVSDTYKEEVMAYLAKLTIIKKG